MSLPYCGVRSIEFLCDYVDNWIRIIDMILNIGNKYYKTEPFVIRMANLKDIVFSMTILDQSIKELHR